MCPGSERASESNLYMRRTFDSSATTTITNCVRWTICSGVIFAGSHGLLALLLKAIEATSVAAAATAGASAAATASAAECTASPSEAAAAEVHAAAARAVQTLTALTPALHRHQLNALLTSGEGVLLWRA